ncbi:MAG: carbohydrate ABC transporter permease [Armatimonadota bacterium]|nr:carbohydrate ABC transporter permease [Armatimonadota bacterium]MDR7518283.1 carbohydrate ABC transporter permease [Armatimonadota bacterium]MDR7548707.1 carbohydrate ABC transporter permease [Armatimonadota bacterium]
MKRIVGRAARTSLRYATLLVAIGIWAVPVVWVLATSLKTRTDIFTLPPRLWFTPTLEHYRTALGTVDIPPSIVNSALVGSLTMLLTLAISVPAGYAYARVRFPYRGPLFFYTLFTQMAPPVGFLIPFFLILSRLRLLDTYAGILLIYLTITIPFAIWLMTTYFLDVPRELEEAALVDGCSRGAAFLRIVVPQTYGGMAVTAILSFINAWNEFVYASVLTGARVRMAPVAIFGFLTTEETLWGPFAATAVMIMAPVIVVAFAMQRHIVRGLTLGALR